MSDPEKLVDRETVAGAPEEVSWDNPKTANSDKPGVGPWKPLELLLLVIVVVVCLIGNLLARTNTLDRGGDSSEYLILAWQLAADQGYVNPLYEPPRLEVYRAPGLPLLLSLGVKADFGLLQLKSLVAIFVVPFLIFGYLFIRAMIGQSLRLSLCALALLAFSSCVRESATTLWSDLPHAALLLGALWLLRREDKPSLLSVIGCAILVFSMVFRAVAITGVLAVLISSLRRHGYSRVIRLSLVLCAVFVPLLLLLKLTVLNPTGDFETGPTLVDLVCARFCDWWQKKGIGVLTYPFTNLSHIFRKYAQLFLGERAWGADIAPPSSVSLLLGGLLLFMGSGRTWKSISSSLWQVFIPLQFVVLLFWPWRDPSRFLLPVFPFLVTATMVGCDRLAKAMRSFPLDVVLVALTFSSTVATWYADMTKAHGRIEATRAVLGNGMADAIQVLMGVSDEEGIIVTSKKPQIPYALSGRRVIRIDNVSPAIPRWFLHVQGTLPADPWKKAMSIDDPSQLVEINVTVPSKPTPSNGETSQPAPRLQK